MSCVGKPRKLGFPNLSFIDRINVLQTSCFLLLMLNIIVTNVSQCQQLFTTHFQSHRDFYKMILKWNFIVIKYKQDGVKMVGSILISFIEYKSIIS
jgi:hypothetical protein